ncbi:Hypothetical predicted protein [Olea europaea subsp. europaea]|uniref:Uncharacterized protein n=1 Tax=Olea europaea subsp. europaea TaxID=158383 RepID=A0A8S0RLN9_OLEEU|nr:Hypothetical predicted protein [Olea europaea subsp. europaea]
MDLNGIVVHYHADVGEYLRMEDELGYRWRNCHQTSATTPSGSLRPPSIAVVTPNKIMRGPWFLVSATAVKVWPREVRRHPHRCPNMSLNRDRSEQDVGLAYCNKD